MLPSSIPIDEAAALEAEEVLHRLGSTGDGLPSAEARDRLRAAGPNTVRTHGARPLGILARQFRNALLLLLIATAAGSWLMGERRDAAVIGAILAMSVGLGFANEYRAERAAQRLHAELRHRAPVLRDGRWVALDVTALVPGDVVRLGPGQLVPADLRILRAEGLECDETILTGEPEPVRKSEAPVAAGTALPDLTSCALMGTVVRGGEATGVVVATGARTVFGEIARRLGDRPPETAFQAGLRRFAALLGRIALILTATILAVNLLLRRPLVDALLFSLAIAVGITPQLLPAVVTTSLAAGAHRLARRKVLVKRLVSIEDLGNVEVLFTDKTGTLTEGAVRLRSAVDALGREAPDVLRLGLLCNEAVPGPEGPVGGTELDRALWRAAGAATDLGGARIAARLPFDHDRRLSSVVLEREDGRAVLVTKGAPEGILRRCGDVPPAAAGVLAAELAEARRVVAVAMRPLDGPRPLTSADERDLSLAGFLVFDDPPKPSAADSLRRLRELGIEVKVVTGDHPATAEAVCRALGLEVTGVVTGAELEALDDGALAAALPGTTIFARVTPTQKARILRVQRARGSDVAFLGDGVNDAVAIHEADVGISVDAAADVAKDAADIVLLEKDLGVLADGVVEGRRIFANTIKYVFMGTSSNFGNMFSAAAASAFLPFLPMLPSQVLLNNLLYDLSELAIPTDRVDEESLQRPARWDLGSIERFMLAFGPLSSLVDFATFALLLGAFGAHPATFRAGWFIESVATQTLVVFVIRTRRSPFTRSRPSPVLAATTLACAAAGAAIPLSPLGPTLGFGRPSLPLLGAIAAMVAAYLALVEIAKRRFFHVVGPHPLALPREPRERRLHRIATRWSHPRRGAG
ncbi:MAG TPA: magnesium-translocating P-type ATPase [Actinomycetota bacterium]|nr:magnesium-translocating P-type ATPase [Actinomycetota bacterium]